ncbi:MAG: type I-E CRISPR-associated protein Cas7/Cse4/CasC [Thermus sp.]|uniref:type I-E CRISPR-associated protein Cas7/Cse4/CasC n=1 Tax=Thermus sp. TaxID=275 RepID=UPI003D0DAF4F
MKLLEVHILQTVAPSNLNRDDTGSPKDALFGGFRRARISSQAQKRAVRVAFREKLFGEFSDPELAIRTQKLVNERLVPHLMERGFSKEDAEVLSLNTLQLLKKGEGAFFKKDKPQETTYLLFVAHREIEALVDYIAKNSAHLLGEPNKTTQKKLRDELTKLLDGGKAVDLALFGRMLADRPELGVDAAAQVAHALSTHKVDREFDFYTAVDDLNPKEETGAGMMGDVEFYSATLYRYAVVDLDKLVENLQGDKELALKGALAFLEAFALTLPSGKQNSFAAHNPPLFVAFRAGEGMPRNLATAFEAPLRPEEDQPLSRLSAQALLKEWAKFDRVYGPLKPEWKGALDLTEAQGDGVPRLEDLKALKEKAREAVRALLGV